MNKLAQAGDLVVSEPTYLRGMAILLSIFVFVVAFFIGATVGVQGERIKRTERMIQVEQSLLNGSSTFARLLYHGGNLSVCVNNGGLKQVLLVPPNDREFTFVCRDGARFDHLRVDLKIAGIN